MPQRGQSGGAVRAEAVRVHRTKIRYRLGPSDGSKEAASAFQDGAQRGEGWLPPSSRSPATTACASEPIARPTRARPMFGDGVAGVPVRPTCGRARNAGAQRESWSLISERRFSLRSRSMLSVARRRTFQASGAVRGFKHAVGHWDVRDHRERDPAEQHATKSPPACDDKAALSQGSRAASADYADAFRR